MIESVGIGFQPDDPREIIRLSCVRVGRVPILAAGDEVWVLVDGSWVLASAARLLPGGVYWGRRVGWPKGSPTVMISASTFGGLVCP